MFRDANGCTHGSPRVTTCVEDSVRFETKDGGTSKALAELGEPNRRTLVNRANAARSTGPRTAVGKRRVRWNAVKHGILAQATPVTAGSAAEDLRAFQFLLMQLRLDLQPATVLEEMLVERLACSYWRLTRCARAEAAAIAARTERVRASAEEAAHARALELRDEDLEPAERLQDVAGIDSVLAVIHAARERIEADGYLDEDELERFERVVGFTFPGMEAPEERPTKVEDTARRENVLAELARHEEELAGLRSRLVEHEARASADSPGVVLPDEATTNLFLRYEAAAERQFTRTLHELERLQRMRAGEAVPPRLHLEVTSD